MELNLSILVLLRIRIESDYLSLFGLVSDHRSPPLSTRIIAKRMLSVLWKVFYIHGPELIFMAGTGCFSHSLSKRTSL